MDAYRALAAKVDAFFARVAARHGDEMRCASGCDACCRTSLTVTRAEAAAIVAHVRENPGPVRASLAHAAPDRCAALAADGTCTIYDARPIVCRSHGVPVRADGLIDACRLNFARRGPAAADPDCVLDQTTLSATLLALNGGDATRIDLAELLEAVLDPA